MARAIGSVGGEEMDVVAESKNIVICYDGTGNEYGSNNTNVVKTFEALTRDDHQIAFYDPGVGTFSFLGRVLGRKTGVLLGKVFGYGLIQNVEDGYEYLMKHYRHGDKVFIFGFSRGAFCARMLAGMLAKVGILENGSNNLIPYATRMNFEQGNEGVVEGFKKTYCRPCDPHFVGVWDTVASLGLVRGKKFKNNRLSPNIRYGMHAISIDEQRKKFPVSLWDETQVGKDTEIEQVWFAGVHSDVGGWYPKRGLSDIAFKWMMTKAVKAGLRLNGNWETGLQYAPDMKAHNSRTGFWKLWRPAIRRIPDSARIHESVRERIQKRSDFQLPTGQKCIFVNDAGDVLKQ